jgi:hypothetical protein
MLIIDKIHMRLARSVALVALNRSAVKELSSGLCRAFAPFESSSSIRVVILYALCFCCRHGKKSLVPAARGPYLLAVKL